ncbi:MAG: hypothetical protein RIB03_03395 [Henriciella sp.]|uniref:hypothetical protein n=1 Tax=Henriciella sp. TaxID=1968823 RepID=UPI0032EB8AE9
MSSQSGNAPVLYEDRTLFPQPVHERQQEPPPRTGLSAMGVIVVAILAAAVAGAIVWFASQSTGGSTASTTTAEPSEDFIALQKENERLAGVIEEFQENQAQQKIDNYETRIAELEATVDNFGAYGRLAELEQKIAAQKAEIERLLAQPERQRMPASAREIPEPENDTAWVSRVEDELEDYLKILEDRVEWVASWPARNPPPPCSDPENC